MRPAMVAHVLASVMFFSSSLFSQSGDFKTPGRVVNASGQPIVNATITYGSLSKRLSWDYSDANGYFGEPVTNVSKPNTQSGNFTVSVAGPVTIDFFDSRGKKVGTVHYDNMHKGSYAIDPIAARLSKAVYFLKIKTGASLQCIKLLNAGSKNNTINHDALAFSNDAPAIAKPVAAISDQIRVGKTGYTAVTKEITSYTADVGAITLTAIDIEGQVNAKYTALNDDQRHGQIVQVIFPGTDIAKNSNMGTVFGGGSDGPISGSGAGTASQWADFANSYVNASVQSSSKIPILFCLDVVHGFGKCDGATILPHNIGLGCTWDARIVEKSYRVCAIESRGAGITMAFGPCIAVPRNDRWGRVYEGFAETPDLTKVMAKAAVLGFQTWDLSYPLAVCACTKHFAGDGGTTNGNDRGLTQGDDPTLRAIHLPGYTAAVEAQTGSIMASFNAWNGTRMHEHKPLLTDWLKKNQGFDGFVNGDYDGHIVTAVSSPINCMNAGLDVPMSSGTNQNAITTLKTLFGSNQIDNGRIEDAVKRVLRIKYRMGFFSQAPTTNNQVTALIGSAEHRAIAREAVRKSLVCLKNPGGILPLPKSAKVTLVGQHAQDIGLQCGGWTMGWQGKPGNIISGGTTIRKAFENVGGASNISYSSDGNSISGDVAIVVIGEQPYAETQGDRVDLAIPGFNLVTAANNAAGNKPVICILITGRPMDISSIVNNCDVIIAAWLPGTEGMGIADVLYGDYDFTGKLSMSWPTNTAQEPINFNDNPYNPRYKYDFGLNLAGQPLPAGVYTH